MLHAYFRPNGQVLFAPFDPEVTCPLPDTAMDRAWMDLPLAPIGLGLILLGAVIASHRLTPARRFGRA